MKTVLMVKFAFATLILFGLLSWFGHARLGLDLSACLGIATSAWMLAQGKMRPMELGLAATFSVLAAWDAAGLRLWDRDAVDVAVPALLLVQGGIGAISCLMRRPWTAVYAGAQFSTVQQSPIFFAINMVLSALWSVLFVVLAGIAWFKLGTVASETVTGIGLLLSLFGPQLLVKLALAHVIRARETYHWRRPTFDPTGHDADSCDVAVIGAGIGGLTAAALLAASGLKVIVAEQHVVPGGFAHSWRRKVRHAGQPCVFRFDSGVHDISGAHDGGPVQGILAHLGITLDWARLTQSTEVDGRPVPIPEDWQAYVRLLGQQHPESAEGFARFFALAKQIYDGMYSLGRGQAGVPLFPATTDAMLAFARANPTAVQWMQRPFGDLVALHIADPNARQALYALAGYVTDTPETLTVADMVPLFGYYFYGGYYPRGGSGVLGQALADAVKRHGGKVLLKTPVAEILIEQGRAAGIRLANGRRIKARAVISNADYKRTFLDLVPAEALPSGFRAAVAAAAPATSAFMVHLGIIGQLDITPIARARLDDGTPMGLVAPNLVDAGAAPAGFGTLELIVLVPNKLAASWFPTAGAVDDRDYRASAAYASAKAALGDRMVAAAETLIPDLRARIVTRHDATPITMARYDWSSDGAIYGVARGDRLQGSRSPVPGLYVAGAANWGPGIEAVMISGAAAANAIAPGLLRRLPSQPPAPYAPPTEDDVDGTVSDEAADGAADVRGNAVTRPLPMSA